jgi:hypothetical protein
MMDGMWYMRVVMNSVYTSRAADSASKGFYFYSMSTSTRHEIESSLDIPNIYLAHLFPLPSFFLSSCLLR